MTTPSSGAARSVAPSASSPSAFLLIATVAVAINLRPALAALGPVLDLIERSTGLSSTGAGALTTLPVLLMGVVALLVRPMRRLLGERRGVLVGVTLIGLSCAGRLFLPMAGGLLLTALGAGLGIAVVQALMPGLLKRLFGHAAGRAMALYTTGIMGGAALAAAGAADLTATLGWPAMLALWTLPALVAAILWMQATNGLDLPSSPAAASASSAHGGRAWLLLAFFGLGTGAYTLVLAWLPPYYVGLGETRDTAGYMLAGLTLMQVVAGLGVSATIGRFPDRRLPLSIALIAILAGLAILVAAPLALALLAALLLGLGIGALFPLSLIVTLDHADDPAQAGDLTAFVQGGGYILASFMPFFAGWLRDRADLSLAWSVMAGGIVVMMAMTTRLSPASSRPTR